MQSPPDPKTWPPDRLFRLLLGTPRPTLPLTHQIAGAEGAPLTVRALLPLEEAQAFDRTWALPAEQRSDALTQELVAASIWTPTGKAFASTDEVGVLFSDEAEALGVAVSEALAVVSPSYRRSDVEAWGRVLRAGARHPTNASLAGRLGGCVEVGWRASPRPDWFFGLPLGELTDGQWMAFRAARDLVASLETKR